MRRCFVRADRLRLLVFGRDRQVDDIFGWQPAGADLDLSPVDIAPVSPVHDAVLAALMHRPALGRRHLVVALTDGVDAGGVVSSWSVRDAAARSEAVLHLVKIATRTTARPMARAIGAPEVAKTGRKTARPKRPSSAAVRSTTSSSAPDPVDAFEKIFADFRASYVLHYTPTRVEVDGWHNIEIRVPAAPRATMRARRGYYGG